MRNLLITLFLLITPVTANAFDDWTKKEKLAFGFSTMMIGDWLTTLNMEDRYDEGYSEGNWALGKYPSESEIHTFFILKFLLNYYAVEHLPENASIGVSVINGLQHGFAVEKNLSVGLKLKF